MTSSLLSGAGAVYSTKKAASGGGYLNPSSIEADQPTRITILGNESIGGYEVWVSAGSKRKSLKFATEPAREDMEQRAADEDIVLSGDEKARPFYAFWIWNYDEEMVQVFQLSAGSLIDPIMQNLSDEEIQQEPWAYDFKLTHNGLTGIDKRYAVTCVPGKRRTEKVNKQIEAAFEKIQSEGASLSNLLVGADPFKTAIPF